MRNYKAILINPWIYDFAAYNFWCRPLGLLKLAEELSRYNLEMHLVDTLYPYREKRYGTGKFFKTILPPPEPLKGIKRKYGRYGITEEEFIKRLRQIGTPDIVFITTLMTYWYPGALRAIQIVRELYSKVPVAVGGI